jgi:hypothetical protein
VIFQKGTCYESSLRRIQVSGSEDTSVEGVDICDDVSMSSQSWYDGCIGEVTADIVCDSPNAGVAAGKNGGSSKEICSCESERRY